MTDIKSMTMEELKNLMTEIGEKPFGNSLHWKFQTA